MKDISDFYYIYILYYCFVFIFIGDTTMVGHLQQCLGVEGGYGARAKIRVLNMLML